MQKLISLERLKDFLDCCKNLFFTENDIFFAEIKQYLSISTLLNNIKKKKKKNNL